MIEFKVKVSGSTPSLLYNSVWVVDPETGEETKLQNGCVDWTRIGHLITAHYMENHYYGNKDK
jgi:hypothetical protein